MSTIKVRNKVPNCNISTVSFIGYPVLWAISDKEDEPAMQAIFSCVKKRCPNGEINVLMTDDCKDIANMCNIRFKEIYNISM